MLKGERHQLLVEIINNEKKVLAKELAVRLEVSEETIRRDLRELDRNGLIRRIHSGAIRLGPPETLFEYRKNQNNREKRLIAEKAVELIHENSVILIDGGTTNLEFVKTLPQDFHATIITNSPPIIMELELYKNMEVIILGGTLNKKYMVSMGLELPEKISKLRADYYIMGVYNIDAVVGLSVPTLDEATLKKYMADVSSETISLVTSDKLDTISNHVIAPITMLDTLITTSNDTQKYSDKGVKTYYCDLENFK